MKKIVRSQSLILKHFIVSILILAANVFCFAQNKIDLELKVQTAAETVRGGEKFFFTFVINNIGSEKATDVIFIQDEETMARFVSFVPSKGNCEIIKIRGSSDKLSCKLGDLEIGESVNILIEAQAEEWGDISQIKETSKEKSLYAELNKKPLQLLGERFENGTSENLPFEHKISVEGWASSESNEINGDNNRVRFDIKLQPSLNIPPRVEILSPVDQSVVIKSIKDAMELPIKIKAFDPDGKIRKVEVLEQNFQIIVEDNQYKFVFGGKKFTAQEVEDNRESLKKYFGGNAQPAGDNTYTYIWKSLKYGKNKISVTAIDDGGRYALDSLEIEVKSDATVEFITPKDKEVFAPNSTIIFETTSQFGENINPKIDILKNNFQTYENEMLTMTKISSLGNTYKHQTAIKFTDEGIYDFSILVTENGIETNRIFGHRIFIAEPRDIKIVSVKNGQEFSEKDSIEIVVEARDSKGKIVDDELELVIDGKSYKKVNNSLCYMCEPRSALWKSQFIEKGTHTIQIIAKHQFGTKLGQSEIITITVK